MLYNLEDHNAERFAPVDTIMNPIEALKQEMVEALKATEVNGEIIPKLVIKESPPGIAGDFGFHCSPLAQVERKAPNLIAEDLAKRLNADTLTEDGLIEEYVAVGPYLNARINYHAFARQIQKAVFEMGSAYGYENIGNGKKIVADVSSPNIAKPMSVGHLRSTIIGDALSKILNHLGYRVIQDNHIGDWGTQFGKLLAAIEEWEISMDEIAEDPIEKLLDLYIKIEAAGKSGSDLYKDLSKEEAEKEAARVEALGRGWFKRLEDGDPEAREKWQQIVEWSLQEFQKMYDLLGVDFDLVLGESFYEPMLRDTIQRVSESGITERSEGALVVNMEDAGLDVAIIEKGDGATLYLTRELATAEYRVKELGAEGMIYVVGEDQKFYFRQYFEILRMMGYPIAANSVHVWFGMVRLPEGRMSTRKGKIVRLEDVVNEAIERARKLVAERTQVTDEQEKEVLAKQIAVGAVKWNDLRADPRRSIVFDLDEMLSMSGNSGPYVQYSRARAMSILRKATEKNLEAVGETASETLLETLKEAPIVVEHDAEKALMQLIASFPQAVLEAGNSYNPSKVANQVYELAKTFNVFYQELPILNEEDSKVRDSRLAMTAMTAQVIQIGLNLLGIEAPDRM